MSVDVGVVGFCDWCGGSGGGLSCWLWGVGRLMVVVVDVGLQQRGGDSSNNIVVIVWEWIKKD